MKLVIGGVFQGKTSYAKDTYHIQEGWIDGHSCGMEEIFSCRGIHHFHEYAKRMLRDGSLLDLEHQAEGFAEKLFQRNPDIVIVSNELGCGVVPVDKEDRIWRELVGRLCTSLAERSDEVVRVMCGIGMKLKQ